MPARFAVTVIATNASNNNDSLIFSSLSETARAFDLPGGSNAITKIINKKALVNGYYLTIGDAANKPSKSNKPSKPNILTELFGDKAQDFRTTDTHVSVFDVYTAITKCKNPRVFMKTLNIKCDKHKFSGLGQRDTPVWPLNDINSLIHLCLTNSRVSSNTIKEWTERTGSHHKDLLIHRKIIVECDYLDIIERALKRYCKCLRQYSVNRYRIDMYIPYFNIAIECDEYGHRRYNQDDEQKRSCIITAKLNCKFVRFDPFHVSFNIGDVISDILEIILPKFRGLASDKKLLNV